MAQRRSLQLSDCLGYTLHSRSMLKPKTLVPDTCSYELQSRRRHQLPVLVIALWLTCSAFTWPGRAAHLSYVAKHGTVEERVEALRLLEENAVESGSRDAIVAALEDDASEVRAQAASSVVVVGDSRASSSLLDLASAN